eukprot:1590881-Rhodomonas_salina.2
MELPDSPRQFPNTKTDLSGACLCDAKDVKARFQCGGNVVDYPLPHVCGHEATIGDKWSAVALQMRAGSHSLGQ